MTVPASASSSPWALDSSIRNATPLAGKGRYDVCVIGGGIAGLTTAYLLATHGKSVVVLDGKTKLASGETFYTTAHLSWVIDDRFHRVVSIRGEEAATLAAESHRSAIDLIETIVRRESIDCDFQTLDGFLFPGHEGPATIRKEMVTMTQLGLVFERVDRVPFPAKAEGPALRFANNAQFHPLKYVTALADLIRQRGGVIHTETQAANIVSGTPCVVNTKTGGVITADAVVAATGSPFDTGMTMHMKVAAYITYAIALEIPIGSVPRALYWDTEDPYHYVRTAPIDKENDNGKELLIVGGEDHKTGQSADQQERWEKLEAWARQRFPQAGEVVDHWSGEIFETPDGLGFIGRAPGWRENVYVITGDSGMGMTHGTLGARLVTDLILGHVNPYAGLYSPSRWMPGAMATLFSETANMAAQYASWLTSGEVTSPDEIPPGHGAIIRSGLTKLAVYNDEQGHIHEMSAVCPHMGGIVQWNPGEKTWDCPCHGSRFKCTGEVTHGPAVEGLSQVLEPEPAASHASAAG